VITFVVEPEAEVHDPGFEDRVIQELGRPSELIYIDDVNVEFGIDGEPEALDRNDLERRIARAFPNADSVRVVGLRGNESALSRLKRLVAPLAGSRD
jgi:hypothetical protein